VTHKLKVAIVQDSPVPLAIGAGLDKAVAKAREAIEKGARVVAIGAGVVGGDPAGRGHVSPARRVVQTGPREQHALLLGQAIHGEDPRFQPLQWTVDIADVAVSIGGYERVRQSLYATQFLFRPKAPVLRHRKLILSPAEKLMLGQGDGSTLGLHAASWGRIGQLASTEHWMPLARAAMHHEGEAVHVAAWPSLTDIAMLASAHYAYEGRAFVLAAGTVQHRQELIAGYEKAGGDGSARKLLDRLPEGQIQHGHSAILAPDGAVIAQAGAAPEILMANIDLDEVGRGLATMDVDGAQARHDVFELSVDRRARAGIVEKAA
jgi:predicted amidohydrolase